MSDEELFKINRRSLGELVRLNVFHIPDFQREYKWGEEQSQDDDVDEFKIYLKDLQTSFENRDDDKEYYVGTIITYKEEDESRLQIIDGQQRISSLVWILIGFTLHLKKIKASEDDIDIPKDILRKRTFKGEKNVRLLSTSDVEGEDFLKEFYERFELPKKSGNPHIKNQYSAIKQSLDFFNIERSEHYNEKFIDYILDNVIIAHVAAQDFRQAFIVFERMNDRGRELSVPDKMKYLIMKKYSKTETVFKQNSETITRKWRKVADQFDNDDARFTTYLMHYFTAVGFFTDDEDNEWYSEKQIVNWFRVWIENQDPPALLEDMYNKSVHYLNFLNALDNRKTPKENIDLKYRRRFFRSVRQPIPMLLAACEASNKDFKLVCSMITKLCLVMSVTNESWQKIRTGKEKSIQSYIKNIRKGDFEAFQKDIESFFDDYSGKFQQNIVQEDYFSEKANTVDLRKFIIVLLENIIRKESGTDEETFIDDSEKTPDKENSTQLKTAEHILPKNDEIKALSRSVPPEYEDDKGEIINLNERDILALVGRFGNFVALDRVTNGTFQDMSVEQKYEEGGFETSTRTSRLLVKDYLTVKSSEKHKKLLKKYHYEPIELTEVGKKKYFLLEQVQKREHIMLNVLGKYIGVKFEHPNQKDISCSFCK